MKRIALVIAATAFMAARANATVIFSDNFNRANGGLGSNWSSTNGLGLPAASISGNQACATDHGFDSFVQSIGATHVGLSFAFTYSASDNELYAVMLTSGGGLYIAGCDGGSGGTICTPKIGQAGGSSTTGTPITLTAGTTYGMTIVVNGTNVDLTIADSGGTPLRTLSANPGATFTQYGFLAGRTNDANLTCIDNFLLEDLNDTTFFTDNFNRADGALGSNWNGIGQPELAVSSNQACYQGAGGGPSAIDLWSSSVSSHGSVSMQMDMVGTAAIIQGGFAIADFATRYITMQVAQDTGNTVLKVESGLVSSMSGPDITCAVSSPLSLVPATVYHLSGELDPDGSVHFSISDSASLNVSITCTAPVVPYGSIGILADAPMSETTCIDNFELWALAPVAAPTCSDTVQNGSETGVDCGGGTCPACGTGGGCSSSSDCASGVCTSGTCQAASCSDHVQNGSETGVDCGGSCTTVCPGCLAAALTTCRQAPVSSLQIADKSDDGKDKFAWSWKKGAQTTYAEFGDPTAAANYQLCVYDNTHKIMEALVPPAGTCNDKPCWAAKPEKKYAYKNKLAEHGGIAAISLGAGDPGKTAIAVKGSGMNLSTPTIPLVPTITVQLQNLSSGLCWESKFTGYKTNDGVKGVFKAAVKP